MSKKSYKEVINNIKISDEAVEKAIKNAKPKNNGNIIQIKNNQIKFNKKTAIFMAASVAVVTSFVAIVVSNNIVYNKSTETLVKNNFVLKSGSNKLDEDEFIELNHEFNPYTINIESDSAAAEFYLDLQCEGENIDTITYKAINGSFFVNKESNMFLDKVSCDYHKDYYTLDKYSEECSSYTVKYNNQPNTIKNHTDGYEYDPILIPRLYTYITAESTPEIANILKEYSNIENYVENLKNIDDTNQEYYYEYCYRENLSKLINDALVKDLKIIVTIKFKDGTTQSQTIVYNSKWSDNITGEQYPIIEIGTVVLNNTSIPDDNNSFTLMYDEEKITDTSKIAVKDNGRSSFIVNDYIDHENTFDIRCEGKDIEKVTYSAKNAVFMIDENYTEIFDKVPCAISKYYKKYKSDSLKNRSVYSSYSVNYEQQFTAGIYDEKNNTYTLYEQTKPVKLINYISADETPEVADKIKLYNEYITSNISLNNNDIVTLENELYNKILNDIRVTITITFKDGTTKTETIIYKSVLVKNDVGEIHTEIEASLV